MEAMTTLLLALLTFLAPECQECPCDDPTNGKIKICEGADTSQTKITITDAYGQSADVNRSDNSDESVTFNNVTATPNDPHKWGDVFGPPTDCEKVKLDC